MTKTMQPEPEEEPNKDWRAEWVNHMSGNSTGETVNKGAYNEDKRRNELVREYLRRDFPLMAAQKKADFQIIHERNAKIDDARQQQKREVVEQQNRNAAADRAHLRPDSQKEYDSLTAGEKLLAQYSGFRAQKTDKPSEELSAHDRIEQRRRRIAEKNREEPANEVRRRLSEGRDSE
ncbi:hypothetical protein F4561_005411 [Lipingzhangella halophila]|uniref:Uncharacterized protein n=1 Tax=Lipingzhangella halophila TaxID=1783352 RepID=A0A7W7W5A7_9ACTN|nr:hypothetical protein [Lipingzhangella halophila]MBB4934591.1 hypothetical protein [Lipingzhangella halophila]